MTSMFKLTINFQNLQGLQGLDAYSDKELCEYMRNVRKIDVRSPDESPLRMTIQLPKLDSVNASSPNDVLI